MIDRRRFLTGLATLGVGATILRLGAPPVYARPLGPTIDPIPAFPNRTVSHTFIAAERHQAIPAFGGVSLPMWTYAPGEAEPLIRLKLGDRLEAKLVNNLPRPDEHTSMHWHGIRLPIDQDGVPYLSQLPIRPGESFQYGFTPPDTGTYFFHSHCNTSEQLGRGMVGVLIVDGDTTEPYDSDDVILLREWRVNLEAADFRPMLTLRGAGRAGSYGMIRTANGAIEPNIALPAGGDCRLRLINADPTRVMKVALEGAEAAIIAVDGVAIVPHPFTTWDMGPAMRIDLVVRAPAAGWTAALVDIADDDRVLLAQLIGTGVPRGREAFDPLPLRAGHVPEPDLASAERLAFAFGDNSGVTVPSVILAGVLIGSLCLSQASFWTINGQMWPEAGHEALPGPLATLERGKSYRFELQNRTLYNHPVHIHGHSFKVLRSNQTTLPVHFADTVLIRPDETVEVAFVADNPGDWMFHCHVLEHQETGMMGYLRVV